MLGAGRQLIELGIRFLQVFPLTFFWWLYVVSGVTALRYLTVPMFR